MATRKTKKRRLKKYAIGDMRERITIHVRTLTPPTYDDSSFTESYDTGVEDWAELTTPEAYESGAIDKFDDVNIAPGTTHIFTVRFDSAWTAENIIVWNNDYYKVLKTRDPDGRSEYTEFQCRLLGDDDYEANT